MSRRSAHGVRGARKPAITTPMPLHEQLASKQWASKQDHGASSLQRFVDSCHDEKETEKYVAAYVAAYADWESRQELVAPDPSSASLLQMFGRVGLDHTVTEARRCALTFGLRPKALELRHRGVPVGEWKFGVTHDKPSVERKRWRHECPNAKACPDCGEQSCETVINRDRRCSSCKDLFVHKTFHYGWGIYAAMCFCEHDDEPMPDARRQRRR